MSMENTYYAEYVDAQNQLENERSNSAILQQQVYDKINELEMLTGELSNAREQISILEHDIVTRDIEISRLREQLQNNYDNGEDILP